MDKYLDDLKNAVDSVSADSDLTERAMARINKEKAGRGASDLNQAKTSVEDIYIQTDVKKAQKIKGIIPAATAACLIAGMVSLPFILGSKSSERLSSGDEIFETAYTGVSGDNETLSEKTADYELKEIKTFSEYKVLSGVEYAAGFLNINAEPGYRNSAVLAYSENVSFFRNNTFVEFFKPDDITNEYFQKADCRVSCGITDFYVSEEGDIYYCGWLKPDDSDAMDGIIGKYNQKSGEKEFLKIFDEMLFEMIEVTDSGVIRTACADGAYYQLDSKAENIKPVEEEPDIFRWPSRIMFDLTEIPSPYLISAFGHSFNGKYCILLDFMSEGCLRLCRMNIANGDTGVIYSKRDFNAGRDGNIYTDNAFGGNAESHLLVYNRYPVPMDIPGAESLGNGYIRSCDINICTDFTDNDSGKYRHSLYSPEGVKLYDFDIPDEGVEWLGNISEKTGEKIYYISGDRNKVLCFEPETNQLNELTTLNEKFDFYDEEEPVFVCMTKSEKYNFLIWSQKYLYGYNVNSDELTLITGTLDYYGTDFTDFTADDDGNIYCTAYGSSTLYSVVPNEKKINPKDNLTESDQTQEKKFNIKRIEPQYKDEVRISSIEVINDKIMCVYNLENGEAGQQRAVEYDIYGNRLNEKIYPDENGFYQTLSRQMISELYVLTPSEEKYKDGETQVWNFDYETLGKLGNISIRPADFPELYFVKSAAECENGSVLCVLEAGIYGAEVSWAKKPDYIYKLAVVSPSGECRVISDGTASEMFREYNTEPSPQKDGTFAFVSDGKLYSYDALSDVLSVVCSLESDYCSLSGPVSKVNDDTYILTSPENTAERKDFYIVSFHD